MNCRKIKKLIPNYLLEELSEIEAKLMEQHLKTCPECTEAIKTTKKVFHTISKSQPSLPPEYYFERFTPRIMEKLKHKPKQEIVKNKWWKQSPVWATGAVTALLVALMLFYVSPTNEPSQPNVPDTTHIDSFSTDDDIYKYDIIHPFDEISNNLDIDDEGSYSSLSYLPLDDDEKFEVFVDDEQYSLTEDEFKELIQMLRNKFLS
jgi:Putative zinc-finger